LGKALIQGHYEKWHQAQWCVPSSDNALVLCDVLSSCTAPEPKALPEVAPSFCDVLSYVLHIAQACDVLPSGTAPTISHYWHQAYDVCIMYCIEPRLVMSCLLVLPLP
jgi:hypothetical protein